jgi:hypothetical protein
MYKILVAQREIVQVGYELFAWVLDRCSVSPVMLPSGCKPPGDNKPRISGNKSAVQGR